MKPGWIVDPKQGCVDDLIHHNYVSFLFKIKITNQLDNSSFVTPNQ